MRRLKKTVIASTIALGVLMTLPSGATASTPKEDSGSSSQVGVVTASFQITNGESILNRTENLRSEASTLSNDIVEEIARLKEEQKRLEEEQKKLIEEQKQRLVDFKASAKTHKFANYDITTKTNLTGAQLDKALKGTGLEGLGVHYAKAEQEYGVSALALIGMSALESSWGTSRFARERHNLFGYQAYDRDTNRARHFESKEEAIMVVARHLANNYLTEGAKYYHGKTLKGVNVRYASDKQWHSKITSIMVRVTNNL